MVHNPRYDHIRAALADGKGVGPLTSVTSEFHFSGFLVLGCRFVHHPRTAAMGELIHDDNALGKPTSITSTFTWKGPTVTGLARVAPAIARLDCVSS